MFIFVVITSRNLGLQSGSDGGDGGWIYKTYT